MKNKILSNIVAFIVVLIWASTFISTKVLLEDFSPITILVYRFFIAIIILFIIYPRRFKVISFKHELLFIGAGLSGFTFYFILQNIALSYTTSSNLGIIASLAPISTMIFTFIFFRTPKFKIRYVIGFLFAILGVTAITLNGAYNLKLNPLGDILAVLAMISWGVFAIFQRKIASLGYTGIGVTRREMLYGFIFIIPFFFIFKSEFNFQAFKDYTVVLNVLFLGVVASALAFVMWNYASSKIGSISTNIYLYLNPVLSTVLSMIFLNEKITGYIIGGMVLSILGLVLSTEFNEKDES